MLISYSSGWLSSIGGPSSIEGFFIKSILFRYYRSKLLESLIWDNMTEKILMLEKLATKIISKSTETDRNIWNSRIEMQ